MNTTSDRKVQRGHHSCIEYGAVARERKELGDRSGNVIEKYSRGIAEETDSVDLEV